MPDVIFVGEMTSNFHQGTHLRELCLELNHRQYSVACVDMTSETFRDPEHAARLRHLVLDDLPAEGTVVTYGLKEFDSKGLRRVGVTEPKDSYTIPYAAGCLAAMLKIDADRVEEDGQATVCLLTCGRAENLQECLNALRKVRGCARTTIVDNGCPPEVRASLIAWDVIQGDRLVEDPNRMGVTARNLVWRTATTEFVGCVDDDIEVPPDWVEIATRYLKENPKVGLVGLKTIMKKEQVIEHCGAVYEDGGRQLGYAQPDGPIWSVNGPCGYVPTMAVLARRKAVREVGYFWHEYAPVWYEDVDLCYALRAAGWEVHVCTDAVVYHVPHGTSKTMYHHNEEKKAVFLKWWGWMVGKGI